MITLPEKITQLLSSQDIEMVQLGANWLQASIPQNHWKRILAEYSNQEYEFYGDPATLQKWQYIIDENGIRILPIYRQQNYKLYTGAGGMKMFEDALKDYLNKTQKPTKNGKQKRKRGY